MTGLPERKPFTDDQVTAALAPTKEELAASIGCDPSTIIRSVLNQRRTAQEGKQIWTTFVDQGDPENAAVFETEWPQ